MFLAGLVLALIGAALAEVGAPWNLSGLVGVFGLVLFAVYSVAWRRASMAGRALRRGPFQRVRAVGWCRPGDGCNYAVFANDDDPSPDLVVRLPLRRDVESEVEGWFAGETNPVLYGGVALFGADGLLATGRVLPNRRAVKVWARRSIEPGSWVQRPPTDWYPPGGE